MTLLDAPKFDEARDRRNRMIFFGSGVCCWFCSWPGGWWRAGLSTGPGTGMPTSLAGWRSTISSARWNRTTCPRPMASGCTTRIGSSTRRSTGAYPFARFQQDWSRTSPDNEYGVIQSHKIAAARVYGNVLLVAVLINGRKSGALNLTYDPKTHTLDYRRRARNYTWGRRERRDHGELAGVSGVSLLSGSYSLLESRMRAITMTPGQDGNIPMTFPD